MFLFWTTEKVNKIKTICDTVNFYCPALGEEPIHLSWYSLIPHSTTNITPHHYHRLSVHTIALLIASGKRCLFHTCCAVFMAKN